MKTSAHTSPMPPCVMSSTHQSFHSQTDGMCLNTTISGHQAPLLVGVLKIEALS